MTSVYGEGEEITRGKEGEYVIGKGLLIVDLRMQGDKNESRQEPDHGEEGVVSAFDAALKKVGF